MNSVAISLEDGPDKDLQAGEVISLAWRKSTRSIGNGQCAEAAVLSDGRLAMRDSMDKSGPMFLFTQAEWHTFLKKIKSDDFDSL
jgi:hypothetical protein